MCSHKDVLKKYSKRLDVVTFDLTYKLIRELSPNGQDYRVGAFLTMSENYRITPLAILILDNEQKDTFKKVFLKFFEMFGCQPQTFVTDEQMTI